MSLKSISQESASKDLVASQLSGQRHSPMKNMAQRTVVFGDGPAAEGHSIESKNIKERRIGKKSEKQAKSKLQGLSTSICTTTAQSSEPWQPCSNINPFLGDMDADLRIGMNECILGASPKPLVTPKF